MLRWGINGLGSITYRAMAPAIVAEEDCQLVACVSRDPGRARRFADKFDVANAYTSYDKMLADPDVDAVFIATPNSLHADQVVAAAAAGKHLLCDKPLGISAAEARRAVEACHANGVRLGMNLHTRHMPWVQDVRRLLASGRLGEVVTVHAEAGAGRVELADWRADSVMAGMGTIFSHGVHPLDSLRYMLGSEPVEVMAMFDTADEDSVERQALVLLRFANGARVFLDSNQTSPHPRNGFTLHGTTGSIHGTNLTRTSRDAGELTVRFGDDVTTTSYDPPAAHRRCLAAFTRAVLAGKEPDPSGVDGLRSAVLCDAIARSARDGRLVRVPPPDAEGVG